MWNPFKRPPATAIVADAVYDAERLILEHSMAAEHHDALAKMYQTRLTRLTKVKADPASKPAAKKTLLQRVMP